MRCFLCLLICTFSLFGAVESFAQGERGTVRLSGMVIAGDTARGVPGVHVYIPRAGLGTSTNYSGMFSLPVLAGDTVVFSAVSYKTQKLIIPARKELGFSVLIDLQTDTTFLPVVEVFPYPTPEQFKEAFLALELPEDESTKISKNLNPEMMRTLAAAMPMSGAANHKYRMNQHINQMSNRFFAPTFSILNPFAWINFIKSVKRGDLKRKKNK